MEIQASDKTLAVGLSMPADKQPFLSAIIYMKNMLRDLLETVEETSTTTSTTPLAVDTLHFGAFLQQLEQCKEQGRLYEMIKERRLELMEQKEHWRPFVQEEQKKDHEFYADFQKELETGKLIPSPVGNGGAYFLVDPCDQPRYVVKFVEEDIFCLNNAKEYGSPFHDREHRVRDEIPLYRSAQTEAFCCEVASLAGIAHTTPKTVMGILFEAVSYDCGDWLEENLKMQFLQTTGRPDPEKLCSIQEFIPEAKHLTELLHEYYVAKLSDAEIAAHFDQSEFEEICLLLWLCYDTDAHGGNFLTYVKRVEANGKNVYGIKKIDNGLAFPEKNSEYFNILTWMPNSLLPLSEELKQKIFQLPIETLLRRMDDYELSNCKEAFMQRVEVLQTLAERDDITLAEVDIRLNFLSKEGGGKLALCALSTREILNLLINTTE